VYVDDSFGGWTHRPQDDQDFERPWSFNGAGDKNVEALENQGTPGFAVDFAAGLLGGMTGLVFGHPFDTIKVQQQTSAGPNSGMMQCLKQTLAANGAKGLFRGMAFPLVGVGVLNSIFFGVYGNSIRYLTPEDSIPTYSSIFVAGSLAGAISAFPACPMELVKVKLQTSSGPQVDGPLNCLRSIHQQNGLRGCFRGLQATILRELPGFGVYITSYQLLCDSMVPEPGMMPGVPGLLLAGGLAGVASWGVNIPIDIIKSRLQTDDPANPKYRGFLDCARKSYQSDGIRVFWRGLLVSSLRAFPTNAVTFAVYSTVMRYAQSEKNEQTEPEII